MRRPRMPKYFIKLMVISLLAGMIPIVVFAVYSNFYFSKNVQRKVDELNVRNLSETMLRMEQLLTTIDYSLTMVANSGELRNVYEASYDSKHFQLFQALSAQMLRLQSVDMGILNVYFVHFDERWVTSNRGVEHLDQHAWGNIFQLLKNKTAASGWITAIADELQLQPAIKPDYADGAAQTASIVLYKKTPLNAPDPVGLLAVQISRAELERRINWNEEAPEQFIFDAELNVAAGDGSSLFPQGRMPVAIKGQIISEIEATGSASIQLKPGTYGILKQSSYNKWYYMSVYSTAELTRDATQIRKVTIGLSLIILVITIMMSLPLNRGAYRPIKRLYDTMARHSNSDRRNEDEFQFIGERMEALIDTSGNMKRQMVDQIQKLRELYLFKLLLGEVDAAEADRQLAYYEKPASANNVAVLVLTISSWSKSSYSSQDIDIMMFAINNMISELIPAQRRLEPVIIGADHVLIIRDESEGNQDDRVFRHELTRLAQQLQGEILKYLKLHLHIGISRSYESMRDLPRAYNEALEAVKKRNVLDEQSLAFHEDVFAGKDAVFVSPRKAEKELIVSVHENNLPKSREALRIIIRELLNSNINFTESQLYMVRLLVNMLTESLQPGESMQLLSRDNKSVFEQLFRINTVEEMEKWFDEAVLQPLIQNRAGIEDQPTMKIVGQMVAIIHSHYHTDLTLETCADKLNFNPDYLRRIFRRGLGMNFSEYLAQYRFQMSMELLKQPDWTVADIAVHLNYNNPQNFIRSFKKITGVTPGQYREQIRLNKT